MNGPLLSDFGDWVRGAVGLTPTETGRGHALLNMLAWSCCAACFTFGLCFRLTQTCI